MSPSIRCQPARRLAVVVTALAICAACATAHAKPAAAKAARRDEALVSAQVWRPTKVDRADLRTGPRGPGAFRPGARVECTYDEREMNGNTPKFTCVLPNGDALKVKYGEDNGEVYAEVAATRLLWALGFGADRMYPVRVRCHGCPDKPGAPAQPGQVKDFPLAAVERKFAGRELDGADGAGWAWPELDKVDPSRGGAPAAQRDALKLLAAMLQHTDSKSQQQRLVCLDGGGKKSACRRPFLLVSDLGKTFGKANAFNRDAPGSVNLKAWAAVPVWADATGCRAHLDVSLTGTLENPVISDAGRRFLAGLLSQLTDRQLRELFTVARFDERAVGGAAPESVDAWVRAFKAKVVQIEDRSCLAGSAKP